MQKYLPDEEIDELCDAFEQSLRNNQSPSITTFLDRVESHRQPRLLYWLLLIQFEFQSNQQHYSETEIEELLKRFPEFESVIHDAAHQLTPSDSNSSPPQIPGYTLHHIIERGGQGAVYQALQDRTGQNVAIKLVSTSELDAIPIHHRTKVINRLEQEIRIAASLKHKNVVRIYDAGECADGFYFVMQLVEGGSLADRANMPSQFEAAKIIRSVANALHEAHVAGILHLDVKPQNILMDDVTQQPLIADFGLARLSQESANQHVIAGTLGFMAPEQAMGVQQDARTDVFGLGATLYYLLTGKTAYQNVSIPFKEEKKLWFPKPARELNRDVNPGLARICERCLEFDPENRFQNCQEIAAAIDRFADAEDGRRIAQISQRTILTCPLFLLINLIVYLQLWFGWAEVSVLEPVVWLTMFSMYLVVFFVFTSVNNNERFSAERLAVESMWAVWLAKMLAAIAVAGSLRLFANDLGAENPVTKVVLLCYPMFSALTGFVLATIAPRYWRKLYVGAAFCFLSSFVLMWTIVVGWFVAPILYGAGSTALAAIWGFKLKQLVREQSQLRPPIELAETLERSVT